MQLRIIRGVLLPLTVFTPACMVGPKYSRPVAPAPPAFKEQLPPEFREANLWKPGEPRDDKLRGNWWEVYKDSRLNALEEQVRVSNLNIAQAEAQFREARSAVRIARADLYPTVTGGASATRAHETTNRSTSAAPVTSTASGSALALPAGSHNDFQIPFDATYEIDAWGRVRNNIAANVASAQSSAADLETMRLSMHAELATDYFQLRGLDAEKQLLDSTVVAYQKALDLTNARHNQGIASGVDVEQARTQLETTRAQSADLGVQRTQLEHAIAVLTGKSPSELTIELAPLHEEPPAIPIALPSELLERRGDIASAERHVASANAQIGVAMAAFYPTISLSASGGLESSAITTLIQWPSRFWSLGASLLQTVFDAGRRRATTDQAIATYDATVAAYRLSVLTAFQDVEDNLAALRVLEEEAKIQAAAVKSAQRSLELANNRYVGGITTYLEVITAQSVALTNETTAVNLLSRRMTASVALIKALGGGWDTSALPSAADLMAKQPPAPVPGETPKVSPKPNP
ncbi:MAG TPA: efflux transporter outer membrane subunit [Bryobacteraceae bacterium]|jgi:NodT family efflux transporter outer membrane factor (OMF) lipoprotein|nr:efflux transporter outer membrane subunit [Bryobacteraceae bacterium]